ncbi:aspartyl-tRNA synthetase-like protein [Dothidotthia symphoricarpi CBS 119687]|uniref:Aspartate--tRNA ligase, cytoplasmic n=1 Tax=Dothidotthia symphoricarpi CBS 119687 TaxID=1392245 RepID=A0A6A6ALA2_9PLEO|nr:aspartyl-tRNA synthetase-like protein [Dothidotthia symphoricarpi CBS 119687]KAF2132729.1 aspartyl-tRNA synthetase-like protein [Dothidotthia symphoricarpi CBS 119687]
MSSLKKVLGKLRPGSNSHGSTSEDDSSGVRSPVTAGTPPRTSATFAPRASGDFRRADVPIRASTDLRGSELTSPTDSRASLDGGGHRNSLSGLLNRRTDSPSGAGQRKTARSGSLVPHSPIRAVKEKLHIGDGGSSSGEDGPLNREGEPMSRNQLRKHERQAHAEEKKKENLEKEKQLEARRREMEEQADGDLTPDQKAAYGTIHPNTYAGEWKHQTRGKIEDFSARHVGQEVVFRARIHHLRKMSSKFVFFVFRQQLVTIQGVLMEHADISKYMVYWAEHLDVESVVLVRGVLQEPKAKQGEVTGASIHDVEISVHGLHVEAAVTDHLPFNVYEAEVTQREVDADLARADHRDGHNRIKIADRTRLNNRVIDLRSTASQGIFRIQSGICNIFRSQLDSEGFIEIHTPKLQGGATESGASVFKIDYFGRGAFLAQSPQLAKQMAISADFGKVYEIGAVFRAENSNTYRHLTEYTGLDLEMAIDEHYHEVLRVLDRTFKAIFKGIYERFRPEIEVIKHHFPHEDLVWLEQTPILPFADAVRMLNETGWTDDNGNPLDENEDLGTRDEVQLGRVIKEKLGTDYYILDKFPSNARPFYAMPDPYNPNVTNSFDIFCRGQEILSGGQRIHDADMLLEKMRKLKVDPQTMEEYIQGFQWGAPPHGGGGIGLERILMLMLSLGNIRHASMFPRDPKSLPEKALVKQLRHPEASTMHPPWEGTDRAIAKIDFQPVEKLIANYGDATNTSWLEPRTEIWRDETTGAAVGFVPQDGFAITVGDPLCHESQYLKTMTGYLKYIKKDRNLKPLWLLVNDPVEEVLATKFNWRTFSVTNEQRVDPVHNPAEKDSDVQRKIRHAEKEGVKITDYDLGSPPPPDVKQKVDARVEDWVKGRKGRQVHLTNIHPWQDEEHRQYHIAYQPDGTICALVAMAQLSPTYGWQVKYSLDFPNAPSGSIEYIVTHALKKVGADGAATVTFGGGASSTFAPGHNVKGTRVKVLSRAYHAIATELKLTNKTEFREKLGAVDDPSYICYPPHGLGPMAIKAILNFFEDDSM